MAGKLSIQEISDQLAEEFPGEPESVQYVVGLAQKYGT